MGQVMCNIWVTLDVLNCTASILHMCVMSVERYLGICYPLFYRKRRHKCFQQVRIKIALVWIISILLSCLLFILGRVHPKAIYGNYTCQVHNKYFQVYGSIFAFFIPLMIVIITYSLTAIKLIQKTRAYDKNFQEKKLSWEAQNNCEIPEGIPEEMECNDQGGKQVMIKNQEHITLKCSKSVSTAQNSDNHSKNKTVCDSSKVTPNGSHVRWSVRRSSAPQLQTDKMHRQKLKYYLKHNDSSSSFKQNNAGPSFKTHSLRSNISVSSVGSNSITKEHQASIVLGLVFTSFVIGWTPFFIMNIYFVFCTNCEGPNAAMMQFFEWLGWASSLVNPFIYTIFNKTFRRTFWRLLRCYCCWGQRRRAKWNSHRGRVRVASIRSGIGGTDV